MRLSRRALLTLGGLAALSVTVPACRRMLWQIVFPPDAPVVPPPGAAATPLTAGGRSLVAIVHGDDVPAMVRRALDLLGGLERLDLAGRRVLVKPNVVSGAAPPTTSDPRVVGAVAGLARRAGAGSLAVGDMSAVLTLPTRPNLTRTGIARAAEAVGAAVLAFDEGEWVEVRPPANQLQKVVYVAKAVHEAERLISVPVVKTHRSAGFSCALKNTVGCVHGRNKPWMHGDLDWEAAVAELNTAVRPHLYVVDGLRSMIAGGPWSGESAATELILASGDPVALDAVALALLKSFGRSEKIAEGGVWDNAQIRRAIALGLGASGPERMTLAAESLRRDASAFDRLVADVRRRVGLA
ncbi:MAG TPA: DUF362 domain-containing protein [Methylomirabilota bacterium]|jgi:uncharacterized protein (DUF362 family)|nr:DUF362 domain-containing protein [Methylomirabilota bacterium]